jgi:Endoplasmic reticulum vesicle transporter
MEYHSNLAHFYDFFNIILTIISYTSSFYSSFIIFPIDYVLTDNKQFIFDLSPIAVSYTSESRKWYDYITSILAIIGGTFTAIGILENAIAKALASTKRRY